MIVEHCEMLVGGRRERGYTTNVDKVECRVDIQFTCFIMRGVQYPVDFNGKKMGDEVARRTRRKAKI